MERKPSFEQIFRLTGFHLGAAAAGFLVAAFLFAPKPRQATPLSPRAVQILELRTQAHALANPSVKAGSSGAPGASGAASTVAPAALARAVELCHALAWPVCDPDSVRAMGKQP